MSLTIALNKFDELRFKAFSWRYSLAIPQKIILALVLAGITGLLAQVKIFLSWSPVPITGQTLAVLLSGILLGKWGGVSQLIYAILGFIGIPWFAGGKGGLTVLFGPTSGYIFGFILAAFFVGYFTDKYLRSRTLFGMLLILLFANFVLIHLPGLIVLYHWLNVVKHQVPTIMTLLEMGTIPFIPGDFIKIILVAMITKTITPKRCYNGEVDIERWKSWKLP